MHATNTCTHNIQYVLGSIGLHATNTCIYTYCMYWGVLVFIQALLKRVPCENETGHRCIQTYQSRCMHAQITAVCYTAKQSLSEVVIIVTCFKWSHAGSKVTVLHDPFEHIYSWSMLGWRVSCCGFTFYRPRHDLLLYRM